MDCIEVSVREGVVPSTNGRHRPTSFTILLHGAMKILATQSTTTPKVCLKFVGRPSSPCFTRLRPSGPNSETMRCLRRCRCLEQSIDKSL